MLGGIWPTPPLRFPALGDGPVARRASPASWHWVAVAAQHGRRCTFLIRADRARIVDRFTKAAGRKSLVCKQVLTLTATAAVFEARVGWPTLGAWFRCHRKWASQTTKSVLVSGEWKSRHSDFVFGADCGVPQIACQSASCMTKVDGWGRGQEGC